MRTHPPFCTRSFHIYGFDLSKIGEECIFVHFIFVISKIMQYNYYLFYVRY